MGEVTDEEEQESLESDLWMNLDQGKLQQGGASQKELGHPRPQEEPDTRNFQWQVRGSLNELNSVRFCFLIKIWEGWTNLML